MNSYYGDHAWKGKFLNKLIKDLEYSSYLELGTAGGCRSWDFIECEKKVGVDIDPSLKIPGVLCSTTDEYFADLGPDEKFDMIYIDACHEKNQVFVDFCNAIKHLNEGGLIIMHDIYPLTERYAGLDLNGDCYEFWIELVENYPERTSVFIGYEGDPEGTMGIYYGKDLEFDSKKINELNHSYQFFTNNVKKYIHDKVVTGEELISNAK